MFYLADKTEDLRPGHSISGHSKGRLRRGKGTGVGGGQDIREFLRHRPSSWKIRGLLLIKENQTSQVKEFSAFLCMGRCKSLDSLKSFL